MSRISSQHPEAASGTSAGSDHNLIATLEIRDVSKSFSGIPVLNNVSLSLYAGTVTALTGENGAGKSTLMKIASGQYRADNGTVMVRGEKLPAGSPGEARELGVVIVPQELASIPDMAVYENIFIGREIAGIFGVNRKAMIDSARASLTEFGVDIDPTAPMRSLPVGVRQIIEIVKVLDLGAKVVLLDEPSSAIAEREVGRLIAAMRKLRDKGVALVFTTHKMEEIREVADRVVVLRDGGLVLDESLRDLSDDDIVTAMIGRELKDLFPPVAPAGDEPVLELRGLCVEGSTDPFDLVVRKGEIVGLAGLVGAGRTELIEAIFGVRSSSGDVLVHGAPVRRNRPSAAIAAKIALVPEDRKAGGAVLSMSVLDNGTLPRLAHFSTAGWLKQGFRRSEVRESMDAVRLRSRGLDQAVETLSGGNQQKVVLARWLTGPVDVLLLDEPTRGVDVGARSEIYKIITDLAAQGMAVLMASSDMPEILSLTHRALVLREGSVVGELDRAELAKPHAQDQIFRLASGLLTSPDAENSSPSADDTKDI